MAGSLEGPLAKLARAQAQVDQLGQRIHAVWPLDKRWPVRADRANSGLEYRFYVGELPDRVDADWVLCAGEIMFDLRSALDHLAYQLQVRHHRGRVPKSVETRTQFPIYECEQAFRRNRNRYKVAELSERDQRALAWLQPYVRRKDRWRATRHWLGKLNAVHNIDKHRRLHIVAAAQNVARMPPVPDGLGLETQPVWGPVKSHGHVETWTFAKPPRGSVEHGGVTIDVTLDPDGEWIALDTFLRRIVASVRAVLHRFSDRFPTIAGAFEIRPANLPPGIDIVYQ